MGDDSPLRPHGAALPLVLGALTAFSPLSIDMYLPSLPAIQRDLGTTASATQLTLAAFFAGMGVGQLAYGPLADRLGRKQPLYAGLVLYVLASAGCALAPDVHALIALRFVQALGGAAGAVIARAVVRDLYRGAAAARLLSTLMLVMGVAPVLAPLAGGWLLAVAGWRAIFWALAGLGVACVAMTALALPETGRRDPSATDPRALGGRLAALARDPEFVSASFANGCAYAGMFAYIAGSPFVFIELFHLAPRAYAALFGANAAGLILASQLNRRALARRSPATVLSAASAAMLVAGLALAFMASRGLGAVALASGLFAFVGSVGFIGPNATALAMEHQAERAGVASAVLGSVQFAAAATASAVVSALNDGTARPMALVMAACGAGACALGALARRVTLRAGATAPG